MKIAKDISTPFDYKQLAVGLGVSTNVVDVVKSQAQDPREIAFEILKIWSRTESASGHALYDALKESGDALNSLARKHDAELLQTGKL